MLDTCRKVMVILEIQISKNIKTKTDKLILILKCYFNVVSVVLCSTTAHSRTRLGLHLNHGHYMEIIHFRLKSNMKIHIIKPQTIELEGIPELTSPIFPHFT